MEKLAVVFVAWASLKMTVPGPSIVLHVMEIVPVPGIPSSLTVATSTAACGRTIALVW